MAATRAMNPASTKAGIGEVSSRLGTRVRSGFFDRPMFSEKNHRSATYPLSSVLRMQTHRNVQ